MQAKSFRADIYKNLHKNRFSIRILEGPAKGKVIAHCSKVLVEDVDFVVSEAGRQKVLREKKKNVHAFVRGRVVAMSGDLSDLAKDFGLRRDEFPFSPVRSIGLKAKGKDVTYNPYRGASFHIRKTEHPVSKCRRLMAMILPSRTSLKAVVPTSTG